MAPGLESAIVDFLTWTPPYPSLPMGLLGWLDKRKGGRAVISFPASDSMATDIAFAMLDLGNTRSSAMEVLWIDEEKSEQAREERTNRCNDIHRLYSVIFFKLAIEAIARIVNHRRGEHANGR